MQRIWLMYSEKSEYYQGTVQYADDIKAVLEEEFKRDGLQIITCHLSNISQAEEIASQVKKHLTRKSGDIKKVHLNYTGGTKAMAVHSYRALENGLKEQWANEFSASYLDARDFHIKFDENPEKSTGDLRKLIHLKRKDLFRLHNTCEIDGKKEYLDTLSPEQLHTIMQCIANLANADKLLEIRTWFNLANSPSNDKVVLFNKPKNRRTHSSKEIKHLIDNRLLDFSKKNNQELFVFLNAFPEKDRFVDSDGNWIYDNFAITGNADNSPQLRKFFQGTWLEAYLYWVLDTKIREEGISRSEVFTNYELQTIKGSGSHKFEVDVMVTNGYQICGISCGTTLDKNNKIPSDLKNKGFEVILRSAQMGGDEARAVLVTLLDAHNVFNLENDLKASLGANASRFIVLGINDLLVDRMWDKLKDHIYK